MKYSIKQQSWLEILVYFSTPTYHPCMPLSFGTHFSSFSYYFSFIFFVQDKTGAADGAWKKKSSALQFYDQSLRRYWDRFHENDCVFEPLWIFCRTLWKYCARASLGSPFLNVFRFLRRMKLRTYVGLRRSPESARRKRTYVLEVHYITTIGHCFVS